MKAVNIGGRSVSEDGPCWVIAEAGVNHNGDLGLALDLVDAAAAAGADAIKFQTFRAEAVAAPSAGKAEYQKRNDGTADGQFEMLRRLEFPFEHFAVLKARCVEKGIAFMSTAFDAESLDVVLELAPPCLKFPSGEIDNVPLLRKAGRSGLPIILSTGMSNLADVEFALGVLDDVGCEDVVILHCVSNYPAEPAELNLRAMETLAQAFARPVGLSDHSLGTWAPLAARPLGMCILEKHFTLDRSLPGPDHLASLEVDELQGMIAELRAVEAALGDGLKRRTASEIGTLGVARRSLWIARPVARGAVIGEQDLVCLRPAGGISPRQFDEAVGARAARDLAAGERFDWGMVVK